MPNALHLMNAGGHLSPVLEAEVRGVVQATLARQAARLELDGVDVAVYVSPWDLPETGIFRYAPLDHLVEVRLNPDIRILPPAGAPSCPPPWPTNCTMPAAGRARDTVRPY
ncbi:hypothetical protein [Deinococcus humi]|uniref:Uncharacterized protein n=1 Tax=Deinococcus humi TaxID=662880 RepID=A0A7W8JU72_9DEIO|nr:hypothetical protein [Deinococcus humi]MBB5363244.1 hypothetical protein [Deinococcus humi]GGO27502.1 hypothetical protein GCM10008949_19230 [Deinococcus humi]